MDLWIRSQYKEMLFKVNNSLRIRYNGDNEICFVECDGHKIALYKTRERALEVLDEIQNIIYMNKLFNANVNAFKSSLEELDMSEDEMNNLLKKISVYEMPKE